MAEYKTYTCDKCGKIEAQHLKFAVDTEDDPADGHRSKVYGYADLCPEHLYEFVQTVVAGLPMEEQRSWWKALRV